MRKEKIAAIGKTVLSKKYRIRSKIKQKKDESVRSLILRYKSKQAASSAQFYQQAV